MKRQAGISLWVAEFSCCTDVKLSEDLFLSFSTIHDENILISCDFFTITLPQPVTQKQNVTDFDWF